MTSEEARYKEAKLNIGSLYGSVTEDAYLEQLRKEYDESVDLTDDSIPMGKDLI